MNYITIENESLIVEINPLGAELTSVKAKNGREYMWDGNPNVWTGHAPILFPICGSLKDDKYIYAGKEYTLVKHGFARKSMFECIRSEGSEAEFLLVPNEKTKESYPFDYELHIIFSLFENKLKTTYKVVNVGSGEMYFAIGAHEAYSCPEGVGEYDIIFPEDNCLDRYFAPDGKLLNPDSEKFGLDGNVLHLKDDYFTEDALIFKNHKSRELILQKKDKTRKITVKFDGFDYLLFWTVVGGKYVCVEPWTCLPDYTTSDNLFEHKEGIIKIDQNKSYILEHSICFE